MIPRTFHRVWLDEPVPGLFDEWWQQLKDLHPGWKFCSWEDSSRAALPLRHRELFDSFTEYPGAYALRADLARYEILAELGGVYVDTDVQPLRSFDGLLADRPFIGWENDRRLCPTVIGTPAHHPAIERLVEVLPEWLTREGDPTQRTGPDLVTHEWRRRPDVLRLPVSTFYSVGWWERELLGRVEYPPTALAVHHWAKGWSE